MYSSASTKIYHYLTSLQRTQRLDFVVVTSCHKFTVDDMADCIISTIISPEEKGKWWQYTRACSYHKFNSFSAFCFLSFAEKHLLVCVRNWLHIKSNPNPWWPWKTSFFSPVERAVVLFVFSILAWISVTNKHHRKIQDEYKILLQTGTGTKLADFPTVTEILDLPPLA